MKDILQEKEQEVEKLANKLRNFEKEPLIGFEFLSIYIFGFIILFAIVIHLFDIELGSELHTIVGFICATVVFVGVAVINHSDNKSRRKTLEKKLEEKRIEVARIKRQVGEI